MKNYSTGIWVQI